MNSSIMKVFLAIIFLCIPSFIFSMDDSLSDDPLLVLRQKSLSSPECGSKWRDEYKLLHENIRSGQHDSRFFIVAHDGQGANDRLTSMITGFLAALLSDRAYFLVSYNEIPDFQRAFDTPIVNVNLNDTWQTLLTNKHPNDVHLNNMVKLYFRDSQPLFHPTNDNHSTTMLFGDVPIIWFNSNRGYSYSLIKDSIYGQKLRDYGMNPAYGFNCAFHYLFRPNAELLELAKPITTPFKDKSTIKIGIQIRTGDHKMHESSELRVDSSEYYENFFRCAGYLEETRIKEEHPGKKVLWYFISDSLSLKKDAKIRFGHDKVLANTEDRPAHTGGGGKEKGGKALQLLFSEQLTLALCDYFIISHDSHVGRLAVWLSEYGASKNHSYFEHRNMKITSKLDYCKHVGQDYFLADKGAGI